MEKIDQKSATKVQTKATWKNYSFLWKGQRKGPSIYDVHMEGEGSPAQVDACGRGEGVSSCGHPHIKLKLESCDTILSSSHEKKLATFFSRISSLEEIKSGIFSRCQ